MSQEQKKFVGEKTLADALNQAERTRRQNIEFWGFVITILTMLGGGLWYASGLSTKDQVKAAISEALKQYVSRVEFTRLKTRADLNERQTAQERKEIKQTLKEIQASIKAMADRLPRRRRYRRHRKYKQ